MNNSGAGHLDEGDLLRLIDGELPERAIPAARAHIEACWSCRAQFQEIEIAIGEYVRYQRSTDPLLPSPPGAWPELRFRPDPVRQVEPPGLLMMPSRRLFDLRWALAAAAVLIALLLMRRFDRAPAARAADLLQTASAAEPVKGSIRIRSGGQILVRPALLNAAAQENAAGLRDRFARAHFSWQEPLSARTFAAWRNQLREKEDEVRVEKSQLYGDAYIIRTTTRSSELHRATMTLRARDLRPVREMLEFTGETVEVEQVAEAGMPAKQVAASPDRAITRATSPAAQQKPDLSPAVMLHRMLQVFATLHGLGADLGEPVEISQNANGVQVTVINLSPARQQQLQAALKNISSVAVLSDLGTPHNVHAREAPARNDATAQPSEPSPARSRLQELLGSAQAAEDLTDRALDASDSVLTRVHALRALSKAFPPAQESVLTTTDRQLLTDLRRDHVAVLTQKIVDLRNALQPVLGKSPGASAMSAGAVGPWQNDVQDLFQAAQNLDRILNRELAGDTSDNSGFAPVLTGLNRLERAAAVVRHVDSQ